MAPLAITMGYLSCPISVTFSLMVTYLSVITPRSTAPLFTTVSLNRIQFSTLAPFSMRTLRNSTQFFTLPWMSHPSATSEFTQPLSGSM